MQESMFTLPPNKTRVEPLQVEVLRKLGEGSYGKVYEVIYNQKPAALKIVDKGLSMDNFTSKLIQQEADILTDLKMRYPDCMKNILCYYDISQDRNGIYFVSELMDSDYFDIISNKNYCNLSLSMKAEMVYDVLLQILEGLKILHSTGIIHRDIKLENFLVKKGESNRSTVKIADFGFSCYIKECKGNVGSLSYTPPNVVLGDLNPVWTVKDDLYSLACVIYSSLTCKNFVNESQLKEWISDVRFKSPKEKDVNAEMKWYIQNYDKKIISDTDVNSLKNMVRRQEKIEGKKNPKLEKLYNFCALLLDPTDNEIYTIDNVVNKFGIKP